MAEFDTEKKTLIVIILTIITMTVEIAAGYFSHSMALFADGCHMGTHALALSLTFFTYVLIRKLAGSPAFEFGTGKFSVLSGYTSAILLGITGIFIIKESFERFFHPLSINLNEAILVAVIGFVVNLICILVMGKHEHEHGHCCHSHEADYNFKAAYLHILADLMTSVFAIFALISAKYFGLNFLDPVVGMLGGIIICVWAFNLIKSTGMILLDSEIKDLKTEIYENAPQNTTFHELHVWKTGEDKYALVGKVTTNLALKDLKEKLSEIAEFNIVNLEYYSENNE